MTQAFLNHKTEEKNIVLSVKDYLARCLINAWLDAKDMHGGLKLTDSILQGIATSHYFIAFISQRYVRSDWCMRELEEAEGHALSGKAIIIPVLLDSYDELKLSELPPGRSTFLNSILSRYVRILYNRYDQEQSAREIASAIGRHEKIQFGPVVPKTVGGIELQLIHFEITAPGGSLPTDILRGLDLNIERDFLAYQAEDKKPLRAGKPVAFSGKGPNWLYAYLVVQFKNQCPVYVFNNLSSEYICVYDIGAPPRQLGSVLK
jgi:hypothetical protein